MRPILFIVFIIQFLSCKQDSSKPSFGKDLMDSSSFAGKKLDVNQVEIDITRNSFLHLKLGGKMNELENDQSFRYQKTEFQTGEGSFKIIKVYDKENRHIANLFPKDDRKMDVIHMIVVIDPQYASMHGLSVGDDLQKIIDMKQKFEIHGSEIEGQTGAYMDSISYELDAYHFTYDVATKDIPANTKIKGIRLF
jgi:hypothetical protein